MQSHPDTPIVVEADLVVEDESGDVRRVRFPMSRVALLDAIHQDGAKQERSNVG